jgi:multiple sugar transport system permease protein
MAALILMGLWGVGYSVIIFLAAFQEVPTEMYEAAELDGASMLGKFRHITLPLISPVLYFQLIMGIIGVFQVFATPYIMTGGGPARATLFYTMYLYDNAFRFLRMGYACAMAWILFIIIVALTWGATKLSRRFVHYQGG